jgi:hypothetical protein
MLRQIAEFGARRKHRERDTDLPGAAGSFLELAFLQRFVTFDAVVRPKHTGSSDANKFVLLCVNPGI